MLKRRRSLYRPGRQSTWQKHKARHVVNGTLLAIREDREAQRWAWCEVEGRRIVASANGAAEDAIGESVQIVYSRIDAGGDLREARIAR